MGRGGGLLLAAVVLLKLTGATSRQFPLDPPTLPLPQCGPSDFHPSDQEQSALRALYEATNGNAWSVNEGWLTSAPPCRWHGVQCDPGGHVCFLQLSSNNLHGTLPPALSSLEWLVQADFGSNKLSGTLGEAVVGLTRLVALHLESNTFSGTIPSDIARLRNLQLLELDSNNFAGVPPTIGELTMLKELFITWNQLTGTLPASLGNLTQLMGLYLGTNSISGTLPEEIGNCTSLQHIWLDNNQLTGTIPASLATLSALTELELKGNSLSGSIPHLPITRYTRCTLGKGFDCPLPQGFCPAMEGSSCWCIAACSSPSCGFLSDCAIDDDEPYLIAGCILIASIMAGIWRCYIHQSRPPPQPLPPPTTPPLHRFSLDRGSDTDDSAEIIRPGRWTMAMHNYHLDLHITLRDPASCPPTSNTPN